METIEEDQQPQQQKGTLKSKTESKGSVISQHPPKNAAAAETQTTKRDGALGRFTPSQILRTSQEVRAIQKEMHILNLCCCDCGSWNFRVCCMVVAVFEILLYIPYFYYLGMIQKKDHESFASFVQGTVVELILLWLAVSVWLTITIAGILFLIGIFCRYHPICILHTAFDILVVIMLVIQIILGVVRHGSKSVSNCVGLSLWGLVLITFYIYFAICSYGLSTMIRVGVDKMVPISLPQNTQNQQRRPLGQGPQSNQYRPASAPVAYQHQHQYQVPVQAAYPTGQPRVVYAPAYPAYAPRYYGNPGVTTSDVLGAVLIHDMMFGGRYGYSYGPYYGGYYGGGGSYDDYYGGWGGGYYDDYGGGYDDWGWGYDGGGYDGGGITNY